MTTSAVTTDAPPTARTVGPVSPGGWPLPGRRWALLLGVVLGLVAAGAYLGVRSPDYSAVAQVSVRNVVENPFAAGQNLTTSVSMPTERSTAASPSTAARVQATTRTSKTVAQLLSGLTVQNPANTLVLTFSYTAARKHDAVRFANAFATSYLAQRQQAAQASMRTTTTALTARATVLQARMAGFLKALRTATGTERTVLLTEQTSVTSQLTTLEGQLNTLGATDISPGTVISRATTATSGGMSALVVIVLGLVGGLVVGITLGRVQQATDRRVRSGDQIEPLLGAPVLNRRPIEVRPRASRRQDELEVARSSALLLLRRTATWDSAACRTKVLVVSARPRDGRTTVTARIAGALAGLGQPVLAVSADFVAPRLGRLLGADEQPGLADVLDGMAVSVLAAADCPPDAPAAFCGDVEGAPRLRFVGSGLAEPRPDSGLANLAGVPCAVAQVQRPGELSLLDSSPLFEVADTLAIAGGVDIALVVVALGRTTFDDLVRLAETLDQVRVPVVGALAVRPEARVWSLLRAVSAPVIGARTARASARVAPLDVLDAELPASAEVPAEVSDAVDGQPPAAVSEEAALEEALLEEAVLETAAAVDAVPAEVPSGADGPDTVVDDVAVDEVALEASEDDASREAADSGVLSEHDGTERSEGSTELVDPEPHAEPAVPDPGEDEPAETVLSDTAQAPDDAAEDGVDAEPAEHAEDELPLEIEVVGDVETAGEVEVIAEFEVPELFEEGPVRAVLPVIFAGAEDAAAPGEAEPVPSGSDHPAGPPAASGAARIPQSLPGVLRSRRRARRLVLVRAGDVLADPPADDAAGDDGARVLTPSRD